MIKALMRIPDHEYVIFTDADNRHYDHLGLPVRAVPSAIGTAFRIARSRLFPFEGSDIFDAAEIVIAPIYSMRLLATRHPFVFTLHDLQERHLPENFSLLQRLKRKIINSLLGHAAAGILCESTHVKSDIVRFLGIAESRITVIPGSPLTLSREGANSEVANSELETLGVPQKYVFFPAEFFRHKNHVRLVQAFSQVLLDFPDYTLVFTGRARFEFEHAMKKAAELGISDRVVHLGYVSTRLMAALYSRATVVVIPTTFESISIPVYEAFLLGVAVCASNVTALPEQVGDAGLLFDPYSISDMADKIKLLVGNAALRSHLISRGTAKIAAMSADRYAAQLALLLQAQS
jgi:glycosyltransferase involved in cell wall biosynthesis